MTPKILRLFRCTDSPPALSMALAELAERLSALPDSEEKDLALRKLLKAKDAAVRASMADL